MPGLLQVCNHIPLILLQLNRSTFCVYVQCFTEQDSSIVFIYRLYLHFLCSFLPQLHKSTANLIFILCPPVPARYSEAHWSWVHLRWHLPSAVHDCGEICLNLQGPVLNGSHWSTFAWHCDWRSQSAYHGPGDGQTVIHRWDEFDWLTDCHWATGAFPNHLCTAGQRYYVSVSVCVFMVFAWVFTYIAGFTSVGGHTLSVVTNNQAGQIGQAPYLQRLAGLNTPTGRDCARRLPGQNDVHTTHKHEPLFLCYAYVVI